MTPADHTPAAFARAVTRRFGDVVAVDAADIEVPVGAIFGLLGPDGAGKSTLIRMLAGVLPADSGEARVFGEDVSQRHSIVERIGYMSQRFSMYPDLTVAENIEFFGRLRGVSRQVRGERAARLLESMGLVEFAGRQAQFLSGGMKQKLMLASTLVHEPDLLLLDEPTTGVDPVSRREFWRIIGGLRRQGKTVLVATPYMDEAERCTHIAFMDAGRVTVSGTPDEVRALVAGRLVEVIAEDPHCVRARLAELDGVVSAHVLGDVVRLLVADEGPSQTEIEAELATVCGGGATARSARIDMEAAFAHLAESGASHGAASGGGG